MTHRFGFLRELAEILTPVAELRRRHGEETRKHDELLGVALRRAGTRRLLEQVRS